MRPFDTSKIKNIVKKVPGASLGFSDPKLWLSTGSYLLNYLISGSFWKGVPLEGKMACFGGESGAGKSYIVSGNIIKSAQEQGIKVIVFDTENALDELWLTNLGVDVSDDKLTKISVALIDEIAKIVSGIIEMYKEMHETGEAIQPLLIIIDSLGMTITPNQERQFDEGDMKGDMGIKAKQLTALIRTSMAKIQGLPIGFCYTNHVYQSQDQYTPDTLAGGKMIEYATSVIVQMNKLQLREDEEGNKLTNGAVAGIRASCVVRKTRYNKPFEKVQISIPYDKGMNPYSGLFDFFLEKGILVKEGNRYKYITSDGTELKEFRKNWTNEWLDIVMKEFENKPQVKETIEEDDNND